MRTSPAFSCRAGKPDSGVELTPAPRTNSRYRDIGCLRHRGSLRAETHPSALACLPAHRVGELDLEHTAMRMLALALALVLVSADATHKEEDGGADRFDEEALLRPLPDGAVLVHLQLTQRPLADAAHPRTFPRPVSDLVRRATWYPRAVSGIVRVPHRPSLARKP